MAIHYLAHLLALQRRSVAMEALILEQEKLAKGGNLEKSLEDVQKTIDLLVNTRETISTSTWNKAYES